MKFTRNIVSISLALASVAVGGSAFGQDTNVARTEYDRLRAACGTACDNTVSPRPNEVTCLVWTNLASGLAQAAGNVPNTCNASARNAATALDNAARECGTLTGRAAQLEIDLAICRTPTATTASPPVTTTPRRYVALPYCLRGPRFGNASLVCETRDGHHLDAVACVRMRREHPEAIRRAGCECPPNSLATRYANGRGTFCATVGGYPSGVAQITVPQLENNVETNEGLNSALSARIDAICTHMTPGASTTVTEATDEASVAAAARAQISVNCTEMNTMIQQLFLGATSSGGVMDVTSLTSRVTTVEGQVAQLRRDHDALARTVNSNVIPRIVALERHNASAAFRFFAGIEGGAGVYAGMRPTYALIGFQARARVTTNFHLYGEAGVLAGTYGVAQIQNITGYALGLGIGASFPIGPTTMTVDLGYAMRTYTDTGIHGAMSAADVGLFGDYRGRIHGGQLTLSALLYRGLGISASVLVSTGDAIVGTDVTGEYAGVGGEVSVLGGARLFWEF